MTTPPAPPPPPPESDLRALLDALFQRYGYDFRDYAEASLRRRIEARIAAEGVPDLPAFRERLLADPACMERFLLGVGVHVTSLFRDPGFFTAFRTQVVPLLRTWPFVRVWVAGCASGEEVYSMAILLHEEGLSDKARIYATDLSDAVLMVARRGVYPLTTLQEATRNYIAAGGKASFSEYYTAEHDHAVLHARLRERVVFAQHNLVTDASFQEFNVLLCRNVLIYFNQPLGERVHRMLYASLSRLGYLCLGRRETVKFTPHEADYETVDEAGKIYRRLR